MTIKRYNEKRDFRSTPEPKGKKARAGDALRFVIQKHQASHLHYDFRLEMDGVLKSWAVPKGPSLDPSDKRLAMHVEDHPMDYRLFEGTIPKGNYGAGTVMVWDEGTYQADDKLSRKENEKRLLEGLEKGKLSFTLHGGKLHGDFSLVRMRGRDEDSKEAWLLIKADDNDADASGDIRKKDRSVLSRRSMDEIANDRESDTWESNRGKEEAGGEEADWGKAALAAGGRKAAKAPQASPQLATLVDEAFDRDGWLFEIKWDGYRALGLNKARGGASLTSRNGKSFDRKFPAIREALASLPCAALVDGEITALDEDGVPDFARVQNYEENADNIVYYLFDLLWLDGVDLRAAPLRARKELLRRLLEGRDSRLLYSDHVETEGKAFFALADKRGLEGIVAKDAQAPYQDGRRTRHWLKIKTEQRQEFVIAGYTEPRGSRSDLGSLLLAFYDEDGKLHSAGQVGTGLDRDMRAELKEKLDRLSRKTNPMQEKPGVNAPPHWATPKLICEVRYTEKTAGRNLRHPVFVALREDRDPKSIRWESAEDSDEAVKLAERNEKKK